MQKDVLMEDDISVHRGVQASRACRALRDVRMPKGPAVGPHGDDRGLMTSQVQGHVLAVNTLASIHYVPASSPAQGNSVEELVGSSVRETELLRSEDDSRPRLGNRSSPHCIISAEKYAVIFSTAV
ncbi:hypothetical protein CB1_000362013 [Camelus ferus]|nr:hypothetical protein CB1_000362013 [Camelus ferus]